MARTVARDNPAEQLAAADRAWSEARRDPATPTARVLDAAVDLIVAARLAGRYVDAQHVARDAATLLAKSEPQRLALLEAHACLVSLDAGEMAEAERWLAQAHMRQIDKGDDETWAALWRADGNVNLARRHWNDAMMSFERGFLHIHDALERSTAIYNIGEANLRLGRFDNARLLFSDAAATKLGLDDRWGLAYCWWGLGICALGAGDAAKALSAADKGLELARAVTDPKILSRLNVLQARALAAQGLFDDAEQRARDAVRSSTRASARERADAQLALGEVLAARGFGRRGRAYAEQALEGATKGDVADLVDSARSLIDRCLAVQASGGGSELDDPSGSMVLKP